MTDTSDSPITEPGAADETSSLAVRVDDAASTGVEEAAADEAAPAPLFPLAGRGRKGYERAAVEAFLGNAREAFERPDEVALGSGDVRAAGFPVVRRGYDIAAVDAALTRLEDAFAAREREQAIARSGPDDWVTRAREEAQTILNRIGRPRKRRFDRVGALRYGYRVDEVDFVMDKISGYLQAGSGANVAQVRSVAFQMQRGGYREAQVDALLDSVVEVMLAVE
ncbi:hypothetical protein GCM10009808_05910 [Microbacterium sediminicola]|uniref:DivIVA domain-containing protein n=1 Tax=Microbacterium sediminicola TaxID=415210 RepID=A0ABN2HQC7_9MICO